MSVPVGWTLGAHPRDDLRKRDAWRRRRVPFRQTGRELRSPGPPNCSNPVGMMNGWKTILNTLTIHYGDRIANLNDQ
jgi:hypothetical protein